MQNVKNISLKPVGTAPVYRRKGLARVTVLEAIHRFADLGVRRIYVVSDQMFYQAIGFELSLPVLHWVRKVEV